MSEFNLDTPSNIASMSEDEIVALCDSFGTNKSPKIRAKIVKLIYKDILRYDLSKDLFYVLVDSSKETLVLAPAGGGKTTTMGVDAALVKAYGYSKFTNSGRVPGDRILSLVYTKDNVKDVIDRHTNVVSKLNALEIESLTLDYNLNCSTIHSFCYKWVAKEPNYSSFLGIAGFQLFDESSQMSTIESLASKICEKREVEMPKQFKASAFLSLYNYMAETYSELADLENSNMFLDLGLPMNIVSELVMRYEKRKSLIRKLDQTDLLTNFMKLVDTNPEARKRIQEYYDYIIADEFQDFTPILKDIVKSIIGEHTRLSCIGDDDQAIYGFRGADYKNALNFRDIFPNAKILSLSTNRRCPSNVLSMANSVIRLNKNRYDKVMTGVKGPGKISFNGYNDRIGQYMSIVSLLKDMTDNELSNTIVSSRENLFSLPLSILMYQANLDFYTSKGYGPFDYGLFNAITKVMTAITSNGSKRSLINLYRILPISRKEMCEALHYDPEKDQFLDGKATVAIDKIDFDKSKLNNPKFVTLYKNIIYLSRNVETLECRHYMGGFINMIKKYYWNFISQNSKMPLEISEFCEDFYVQLFNTSKTYKEKLAEILQFKDRISRNLKNKTGVMLSAFHSMKGLEADNIILCDLAESIFPNFSGIDFRPYDAQTKQELKEEETRLCYVALTRSKKNLWLFYSKHDPSYYISFLMASSKENADASSTVYSNNDSELNGLKDLIGDSNVFSDPSSFVRSNSNGKSEVKISGEKEVTPSMNSASRIPSMTDVQGDELEIELDEEVTSDYHGDGELIERVESVSKSPNEETTIQLSNEEDKKLVRENTASKDVSDYVEIKDSVDSEFIENDQVNVTKSHNLGGISVTAKSVNSNYRNNVFNSLFNKKK